MSKRDNVQRGQSPQGQDRRREPAQADGRLTFLDPYERLTRGVKIKLVQVRTEGGVILLLLTLTFRGR